jgi:hypothetical protein
MEVVHYVDAFSLAYLLGGTARLVESAPPQGDHGISMKGTALRNRNLVMHHILEDITIHMWPPSNTSQQFSCGKLSVNRGIASAPHPDSISSITTHGAHAPASVYPTWSDSYNKNLFPISRPIRFRFKDHGVSCLYRG